VTRRRSPPSLNFVRSRSALRLRSEWLRLASGQRSYDKAIRSTAADVRARAWWSGGGGCHPVFVAFPCTTRRRRRSSALRGQHPARLATEDGVHALPASPTHPDGGGGRASRGPIRCRPPPLRGRPGCGRRVLPGRRLRTHVTERAGEGVIRPQGRRIEPIPRRHAEMRQRRRTGQRGVGGWRASVRRSAVAPSLAHGLATLGTTARRPGTSPRPRAGRGSHRARSAGRTCRTCRR